MTLGFGGSWAAWADAHAAPGTTSAPKFVAELQTELQHGMRQLLQRHEDGERAVAQQRTRKPEKRGNEALRTQLVTDLGRASSDIGRPL